MTDTENNTVNIIGTVHEEPKLCKEYGVEKFYSFSVAVKRLSRVVDVLQVLASDLTCNVDALKKGSYVNVVGQLRSRIGRKEDDSRLKIYIFAVRVLECDHDKSDNNTVELTGTLRGNVSFKKCTGSRTVSRFRLLLKRRNNHTTDLVPAIAWGRMAGYVKDLPSGTKINVCGRLQEREFGYNHNGIIEQRIVHELSVQTIKLPDNDSTEQIDGCHPQKEMNKNEENGAE